MIKDVSVLIKDISVFKLRIDKIESHAISFELFAGTKVKDTYVNVLSKGGYGAKSRITLTPKQFSDFAQRLIAYVYTNVLIFSASQLKILWDLKLNVFDNEAQQISSPILAKEKERLTAMGLLKVKKNAKK